MLNSLILQFYISNLDLSPISPTLIYLSIHLINFTIQGQLEDSININMIELCALILPDLRYRCLHNLYCIHTALQEYIKLSLFLIAIIRNELEHHHSQYPARYQPYSDDT